MRNRLHRILNWFIKPITEPIKFIFIDAGYHCYSVATALQERDGCELVAFIDEEPWGHLTELLGVKLYYPSELLALAEKNNINIVVRFEGKGWIPDTETIDQLRKRKVGIISFAEELTLEQALEQLDKQLQL